MITFASIVPHPPALIPSIGKKQTALLSTTIKAMDDLAEKLKAAEPHTIAIISPHGQMRYDKFTINLEDTFKGSFASFGDFDDPGVSFLNNGPVAKIMFESLRKHNFPVEVIREQELDYGTLVPLTYLMKPLEKRPRLITLTFTALDWNMHYRFGKVIGQVLRNTDQSIALIASADLSQRLNEEAPAGFSPYGAKFDETLLELLKNNETDKIQNLNPEFCTEAGECGLRSILIALGALSGLDYEFQQLSYESPMGVGHLVGHWNLH